MKRMHFLAITLFSAMLLLTGLASNALALTKACTDISNSAQLQYTVASGPVITLDSDSNGDGTPDPTIFKVATKTDLIVTAEPVQVVNPSSIDQVLTFTINNSGNDDTQFMLQVHQGTTGDAVTIGADTYNDNFDMASVRVYTDNDNDYSNGAVDLLGEAIGTTYSFGADLVLTPTVSNEGTLYVHIVANTPAAQPDGDDAAYSLKAVAYTNSLTGGTWVPSDPATDNSCGEAIVLADGAGSDSLVTGLTADVANDGAYYATGVYTVQSATITIDKVSDPIWDPINGAGIGTAKAIPGAVVRYTITITNAGSVPADGVTLTDAIPGWPTLTYLSTYEAAAASDGGTINYDYGSGYVATLPTDTSGAGLQYDDTVQSLRIQYGSIPGDTTTPVTRTITFPVYIQ